MGFMNFFPESAGFKNIYDARFSFGVEDRKGVCSMLWRLADAFFEETRWCLQSRGPLVAIGQMINVNANG